MRFANLATSLCQAHFDLQEMSTEARSTPSGSGSMRVVSYGLCSGARGVGKLFLDFTFVAVGELCITRTCASKVITSV